MVSHGYRAFGRKGGSCLRNLQLHFSPRDLGSNTNSSPTLTSSSTFCTVNMDLPAYLIVKLRSFHEEPSLISDLVVTTNKPCHYRQRISWSFPPVQCGGLVWPLLKFASLILIWARLFPLVFQGRLGNECLRSHYFLEGTLIYIAFDSLERWH